MSYRRRLRLLRSSLLLLAGAGVGVVLLALIAAGEIYDYQDTLDGVSLPPVDAIVCLAGGRGRISAAGDLWYRYWETAQRNRAPGMNGQKIPVLYISGMGPQANWNVFSHQIHRGVLAVMKPEDVVLEVESSNTDENAQWVVKHAKKLGWQRIILMTSSYHMRRAKFIFGKVLNRAGVPLEIETYSLYQDPFEPGEWRWSFHGMRVTLLEYLKMLYYRSFKRWPGSGQT